MKILFRCCKHNPAALIVLCLAVFNSVMTVGFKTNIETVSITALVSIAALVMIANTIRGFLRTFHALQLRGGRKDERFETFWRRQSGGCFKAGHRAALELWKELHPN